MVTLEQRFQSGNGVKYEALWKKDIPSERRANAKALNRSISGIAREKQEVQGCSGLIKGQIADEVRSMRDEL